MWVIFMPADFTVSGITTLSCACLCMFIFMYLQFMLIEHIDTLSLIFELVS